MTRKRWYGLYLGDRVIFKFGPSKPIEGTIVYLYVSNNNKAKMIDDDGYEHEVVCEYCERIPPDGLFTFRPLDGVLYTVLIYGNDGQLDVYTFFGKEIEKGLMNLIKYLGDEMEKIAIYVKETSNSLNTLYQEISRDELLGYYEKDK